MRPAPLLLVTCGLALGTVPAFAYSSLVRQDAAAAPAAGTVAVHATWDSRFLYFAFQVDDTDITGTNTRPLSHPEQDDGVAVYFRTGDAPTSQTHAMIVSVAGGFTLLDGDPAAKTFAVASKPNFGIKYGVALQGTLNRSNDRDKGYTITLAVPLSFLGLDPATLKPGMAIGFNAVVRSRSGASLTSLSPLVKTEADVANASNWTRLTLLAATGGEGASADGINAARVNGVPPLIDGSYRNLEWPLASKATFLSPDKPHAVVIAKPSVSTDFATADSLAPALDLSKPITGMQRLLFARYVPTYQADARKVNVPQNGVFGADGTLLLAHQPASGIGPWFSSDRVTYQRGEMTEMRRAGIDVALVDIGGPNAADAVRDEKAVLVLVGALRGMALAGTPAPRIAPLIDLSRLAGPGEAAPDLTGAAGRDALYAAVRRWTRLVPPELRARVLVPASGSAAAVSAYPMFFSHPQGVGGLADPGALDTVRARFAADFGPRTAGTTPLFCGFGDGTWTGVEGKLAAIVANGTGKGAGPIASFTVQPGREDAAQPLVSRKGGATYHAAWDAALAADPAWIVVDSWNDFTAGTEIAASRQYGPRYLDLTRIYAIQTSGLKPQDVRYRSEDIPRRLYPGQVVTTTITVENVGMSILRGEDGIALAYRWRRNGEIVAEGPLKLPLARPLLPTLSAQLPLGLAAAEIDKDGHLAPLPPGVYSVEIGLATTVPGSGKTTFFSEAGGSPALRVPVTIAANVPDYVQFEGTTTPTVVRAGAAVPTRVRLRWMGSAPLPLGEASLVYQILGDDGKTVALTGTVPLPAALPPGQWAVVPVTLQLSEATVPLAPANPELRRADLGARGSYTIRYLITRANTVEAIPGEYDETMAVYPAEDSARVATPAVAPGVLDAGAQTPMSIRVTNTGTAKWVKGAYAVGWHWYDADGLEADWKPIRTTTIVSEVKPGDSLVVPTTIRVPTHEGDYVLSVDVLRTADNVYLSTLPGGGAGSTSLVPIRVRGSARLSFVDLGTAFNADVVADDEKPADGDLDGAGHTLPAESFPPDRFGIVGLLSPPPAAARHSPVRDLTAYPSGYYAQVVSTDRQIAFRYGSSSPGLSNAVTPTGQTIVVEHGIYNGLHLAATATGGKDTPIGIVLHYRDGSEKTVNMVVRDLRHAPGLNDSVALITHIERGPTADTLGPCSIWHLIVSLDVARELTGITLTANPAVKVFAMTLER